MKLFILLFTVTLQMYCYSQNIKLPIDSITNKVTYVQSVYIKSINLLPVVKEWISKKFEIPILDIKVTDNKIKFINTFPINRIKYGQTKYQGIVMCLLEIVVNDKHYNIKITDYIYVEENKPDTINLEKIINKSKNEINNDYMSLVNQIDIYTQDLLQEIQEYVRNEQIFNNRINNLGNTQLKNIDNSNLTKLPGDELIKTTNHGYAGLGFIIGGSILTAIGAEIISDPNNEGGGTILVIMGIVSWLTGTVLTIESYSHIKKAGVLFNLQQTKQTSLKIEQTNYGIGLVYNF